MKRPLIFYSGFDFACRGGAAHAWRVRNDEFHSERLKPKI